MSRFYYELYDGHRVSGENCDYGYAVFDRSISSNKPIAEVISADMAQKLVMVLTEGKKND